LSHIQKKQRKLRYNQFLPQPKTSLLQPQKTILRMWLETQQKKKASLNQLLQRMRKVLLKLKWQNKRTRMTLR
jgi:hypothetical protein